MAASVRVEQIRTLADLSYGERARVLSIHVDRRRLLHAHGVRPGVILSVDGDAPFRGPRIVRFGRARLAIAFVVARDIRVQLESAAGTVPAR